MSKNKFEIMGEDIYISHENSNKLAVCSYRDDYIDELQSVTWTFGSKYVSNKKLGSLHHYMMKRWYGENELKDAISKGYVVDHLDNDGYNCRISNLEILLKSHNTAKGQAFDIDSKRIQKRIAVRLFKDVTTGNYQITIGCNDHIYELLDDGSKKPVAAIRLLYKGDYFSVVATAESILRIYETEQCIKINSVNLMDTDIEFAKILNLNHRDDVVIMIDGKPYLNLDNKNVFINSIGMKKGWR